MNLKCFLYGNHPNNHVSDHHCEMKQLKKRHLANCALKKNLLQLREIRKEQLTQTYVEKQTDHTCIICNDCNGDTRIITKNY